MGLVFVAGDIRKVASLHMVLFMKGLDPEAHPLVRPVKVLHQILLESPVETSIY